MDKSTGNRCPQCGADALNVYYSEGSDMRLGAACQSCGLKGFYSEGKLVVMVTP